MTGAGGKPIIPVLGVLIGSMALATGAFNVASASANLSGAGAQSAAVASQGGEKPAPATGQVVVFETETRALTAFNNPEDCNNAPALAHTIVNLTDKTITLFADDRCGTPLIELRPGFGSHVAPEQSFADIGDD